MVPVLLVRITRSCVQPPELCASLICKYHNKKRVLRDVTAPLKPGAIFPSLSADNPFNKFRSVEVLLSAFRYGHAPIFFSSCVSGSTDDLNPFQARCSGYLLNSTTDEDCIWVCIHFFHNIYAQDIILVLIGQIFVKFYKYKVEEERDTFFRTRSVGGGGGVGRILLK